MVSLTFSARSLSQSASSFRRCTSRWCRFASSALAMLWVLASSASCWASCPCSCSMTFCKFAELDALSTTVFKLDPLFEIGTDSSSVCTPTSHFWVIGGGTSLGGRALLSNATPLEVRRWSNKSEASLAVILAYCSRTDALKEMGHQQGRGITHLSVPNSVPIHLKPHLVVL